MKVLAGRTTSPPGPTPTARSASSRASVPLATPTQCATSTNAAYSCSKSATARAADERRRPRRPRRDPPPPRRRSPRAARRGRPGERSCVSAAHRDGLSCPDSVRAGTPTQVSPAGTSSRSTEPMPDGGAGADRARPRAPRRSCRGRRPRRRSTSPPRRDPGAERGEVVDRSSWVSVTCGITTTCSPTSTSAVSTTPASSDRCRRRRRSSPGTPTDGCTHGGVAVAAPSPSVGEPRRRPRVARRARAGADEHLVVARSAGDQVDAAEHGRAPCIGAPRRGVVVDAARIAVERARRGTATASTSRARPPARPGPARSSAGHAASRSASTTGPARTRSAGGTAAGSACVSVSRSVTGSGAPGPGRRTPAAGARP